VHYLESLSNVPVRGKVGSLLRILRMPSDCPLPENWQRYRMDRLKAPDSMRRPSRRPGQALVSVVLLSVAFAWLAGATLAVTADGAATRPYGEGDNRNAVAAHGWEVEVNHQSFLWASTRTNQGLLGQYCDIKEAACAWVLVLIGDECSEGVERPVLINTAREVLAQTILCMGNVMEHSATYAFTEFDDVDAVIRRAERMAIAVPAEDENIGVDYFVLSGAGSVIDRMRVQLQEEVQSFREGKVPAATSSGGLQEILWRPRQQ
jgi:hypothetical protein